MNNDNATISSNSDTITETAIFRGRNHQSINSRNAPSSVQRKDMSVPIRSRPTSKPKSQPKSPNKQQAAKK